MVDGTTGPRANKRKVKEEKRKKGMKKKEGDDKTGENEKIQVQRMTQEKKWKKGNIKQWFEMTLSYYDG